jgi:hypothetical protein
LWSGEKSRARVKVRKSDNAISRDLLDQCHDVGHDAGSKEHEGLLMSTVKGMAKGLRPPTEMARAAARRKLAEDEAEKARLRKRSIEFIREKNEYMWENEELQKKLKAEKVRRRQAEDDCAALNIELRVEQSRTDAAEQQVASLSGGGNGAVPDVQVPGGGGGSVIQAGAEGGGRQGGGAGPRLETAADGVASEERECASGAGKSGAAGTGIDGRVRLRRWRSREECASGAVEDRPKKIRLKASTADRVVQGELQLDRG